MMGIRSKRSAQKCALAIAAHAKRHWGSARTLSVLRSIRWSWAMGLVFPGSLGLARGAAPPNVSPRHCQSLCPSLRRLQMAFANAWPRRFYMGKTIMKPRDVEPLMRVGERIEKARKRRRISRKEMIRRFITRSGNVTVYKDFLDGERSVQMSFVFECARVLRVPVRVLMGSDLPIFSNAALAFAREVQELPQERQRAFLNAVKGILEATKDEKQS